MNRVYKAVWNEALGGWVAVSELARGRTKSTRARLLPAVALVLLGAAGVGSVQAAAFGSWVGSNNSNTVQARKTPPSTTRLMLALPM